MFGSALPPPSREAGLARLQAFTPHMGSTYARMRNHDFGPQDRSNVSCLSAHVRHRAVLERELASEALAAHGQRAAEKFVQEIFWRTYWKGWLEMRPAVWADYCQQRDAAFKMTASVQTTYQRAIDGETGIACFDAWAAELRETGYLHNHTRMWFASIWIFTLKLPWCLGADYFLRHLIDGDAASNTLSWRWVGGLQTQGKTYLARASNIAKYTAGRFEPCDDDLAGAAAPLPWQAPPEPHMPALTRDLPQGAYTLLVHEEDCAPETVHHLAANAQRIIVQSAPIGRGPEPLGAAAKAFAVGALKDVFERLKRSVSCPVERMTVQDLSGQAGTWCCAAMYVPVGPLRDALGPSIHYIARQEDQLLWPHATKGFFKFKETIPSALAALGLSKG